MKEVKYFSNLKSTALSNFDETLLPTIAFFLFFSLFIAALVWVFRKGSNNFYDKMGNLPFGKELKNDD
jgi:cbb3-type cytochrome oxidase subunit 3